MNTFFNMVNDAQFKVRGITGTYPHVDNCLEVEISVGDHTWTDHLMSKPFYEMWKALRNIKDKIAPSELEEITKAFEDYGEWKYEEASDNASMYEAGEAL